MLIFTSNTPGISSSYPSHNTLLPPNYRKFNLDDNTSSKIAHKTI